jgi:hypothetical protein
MIAVDHLTTAVVEALSTRYCPIDTGLFETRLFSIAAAFCLLGVALFVAGRVRLKTGMPRTIVYTTAAVVLLFAIGGAGLDLFGLSGCTGSTAGVTWDWPW